jgi:S-adenosylmethionine-dependent methyltransferase
MPLIKSWALKILRTFKLLQIPARLRRNQVRMKLPELRELEASIRANYHQGWRSEANYDPAAYAADLRDHLCGRLADDRRFYVPWFNRVLPLPGARILEIGCGTGSSTLALAEQGARVTALDIDASALQVARDRCRLCRTAVDFIHGNAAESASALRHRTFDLVIFFACLEHMLHDERIGCLRTYMDMLPAGAFLSVVGTPNRLWYMDNHTSRLPFYHWLPDRLAFEYARFSDRGNFKELYLEYSEELFAQFLRRGRGFSFHEMEIAWGVRAREIRVADYMRRPFLPFSMGSRFHCFLQKTHPGVSRGFFYPIIDIIIKKQGA